MTDQHHYLDRSSVRVTNLSLDPGQSYPTFYAAEQSDPAGDTGWFVAELPFDLAQSNDLRFEAADDKSKSFAETRTLAGQTAALEPIISTPYDEYQYRANETIQVDASASIAPTGAYAWLGVFAADGTVVTQIDQLTTSFTALPSFEYYTVRLVLADPTSPPSDPSSVTPCAGSSNCAVAENVVTLMPPTAILSAPLDGLFTPGQVFAYDGSQSYVPDGYVTWIGLIDTDEDNRLIASQTATVGQFAAVDTGLLEIRMAVYDPALYSNPDTRFVNNPSCGSGCSTAVVSLRQSTDLQFAYANPEVVRLVWWPAGKEIEQSLDGVNW